MTGTPASAQTDAHEALRRFKAEVFQVLAHPTRIHIVECLREGEQPVSGIIDLVGIGPANASQHLSLLRGKGLVKTRRVGTQVFYSLSNPLLIVVLDTMRTFFRLQLESSMSMLSDLEDAPV